MLRHAKQHSIDSAIIYGFAVISIVILSYSSRYIHKPVQNSVIIKNNTPVVEKPLFDTTVFKDISVYGKSYVVYDIVNKQVLAGKNEEVILPLASITKVMMGVTARLHNKQDTKIVISDQSIDGSYDLGLIKGQIWNLDELLKYTLVFSSNDGSLAIADSLGGRKFFISQMNQDAEKLGLLLRFTHPAGLDENHEVGGTGSALSVAKLVSFATRKFPDIFDATTKKRVNVEASNGRIIGIPNTNQEVSSLTGISMSKTGFTDKAGGNLVVVVDIAVGHPVAIVVLGSTHTERFKDVDRLYKALQKSILK